MEFDRPDLVIRIERLDLKLGTIFLDDIGAATARLETELRAALSVAIETGIAASSNASVQVAETMPAGTALLQALAHYLRSGIWPYREKGVGDPMFLLTELITHDPEGVRQLFAGIGGQPEVRKRLALQMTPPELDQLHRLTVPAQATDDLAPGALRPPDPAPRTRLTRTIADAAALAPTADAAIRPPAPFGMGPTAAAGGRGAPLPPAVGDPSSPSRLEAFLLQGVLPAGGPDMLLLALLEQEPESLTLLLRRRARDTAMLRRMAEILASRTLARLLRLLTPEAESIIIAHMAEVRSLHHARPIVSLTDRSLERLLWFVALRHVLNQAGTQFNRKTFIAHMVAEIANAERVSYRILLQLFASSLADLLKTTPAAMSLAALILELANEPEPALPHAIDGIELPSAEAIAADEPAESGDLTTLELRISTYRHLDRLRHLLAAGVLPWRDMLADPTLTPQQLIEALAGLPPGAVQSALRHGALSGWQVRRALETLPDATVTALYRLLHRDDGLSSVGLRVPLHDEARPGDAMAAIMALIGASPAPAPPDRTDEGADAIASGAQPDAITADLTALVAGVIQDTPPSTAWIKAFVRLSANHRRMAQRFLAATLAHAGPRAHLLDAFAPDRLAALLQALIPAAADTLTALTLILTSTGRRHGLQHRDVAAALLAELAVAEETITTTALLQRMLTRMFPTGSPPWLVDTRAELLPRMPGRAADALVALSAVSNVTPPSDKPGSPAHGHAASTSSGQHAEWLFQALAACDLSRAAARDEVPELLSELMEGLLTHRNRDLALRLLAFLARSPNSAHLLRLLPERQFAQLTMHAMPHAGPDLLDAAEVLTAAAGRALDRATMWQALFRTAASPAAERTVPHLTRRLLAAAERAARDADPTERAAASTALARTAARHARNAGHAVLATTLEGLREANASLYSPTPRRAAPRIPARDAARTHHGLTAFRLRGEADSPPEPIFIDNAGLVLANPFLPHLFEALGLLVRDDRGKPRLRDEAAASRAVHLLQYLVDGRTDAPEPLLVLNKVLCGLPIAAPVDRAITASEAEIATCETLLRSILGNWPILSGTSVAGLRETFLRREGRLTLADSVWRLQVQRKTLDVLVDQIPWSIGVVFHAWMPGALHVTW
jgi:hypothetical protein